MKNLYAIRYPLYAIASALLLSGCIVRTYPVIKDRVDQDLDAGNRGYLQGETPSAETKERKVTRTTQVVEVELYPLIRFETAPKSGVAKTKAIAPIEKTEDEALWGNRGYIMQSESPQIAEMELGSSASLEKYTVKKTDTLQKISKEFYGTTKKWNKIYQANKDILKAPDKIYPGQVINIPVEQKTESLQEPKDNFK